MIYKSLEKIIPSIIIAIVSIVFIYSLHFLGVFDSIEHKLVDFRYNLRGPIYEDNLKEGCYIKNDSNDNNESDEICKKLDEEECMDNDYCYWEVRNFSNKDVVIVEIDDESFRLIPDAIPYGRGTVWNTAVKNLTDAGAKVIVIDAMFDKPDHQTTTISNYFKDNKLNTDYLKNGDVKFLESIEYAKNKGTQVILSGKRATEKNRIPPDYLLKPIDFLINNKVSPKFGLVNVGSDSDGFIRRYPIFQPISGDSTIYYSLAIETVLAFKDYKGDKTIQEFLDKFDSKKQLASIGDSLKIRTYGNGNTFQINYYGAKSSKFKTFKSISLSSVLDTEDYDLVDEDGNYMQFYAGPLAAMFEAGGFKNPFKDKIVVIGSSLSEDQDLHPTPYLNYINPEIEKKEGTYEMPGVEIHANVIQQILDQNFISTPMGTLEYDSNYKRSHFFFILILVIITLLLVTKPSPLIELGIIISLVVMWLSYSIGIFCSDYFWLFKSIFNIPIEISENDRITLLPVIFPITSMITPFALNLSYKLFKEGQDKKFLKNTFGNYISAELVDQMYESKEIPELGGEEGYHSLIYSDIASFSSFSEKLTPTQLVELLNEYLTGMTDIILNNKGTIDKYIGDAIMAFYGAPVKLENHEKKAVKSVIEMNKKLEELRLKWKSEGDKWPDLVKNMQHRVGIIAGNMQTGNMGSELQMNYTCMGDTVNTGARLESGAKHWGIAVQVSETIYIKTNDNYIYRKLGGIRVKGKKESITSYELICHKENVTDKIKTMINIFGKAQGLYLDQKWNKAIEMFKKSNGYEDMFEGRKTNPSLTYISICEEFKKEEPGEDWDGVYTFKQK